jgi:hypothetical protein
MEVPVSISTIAGYLLAASLLNVLTLKCNLPCVVNLLYTGIITWLINLEEDSYNSSIHFMATLKAFLLAVRSILSKDYWFLLKSIGCTKGQIDVIRIASPDMPWPYCKDFHVEKSDSAD